MQCLFLLISYWPPQTKAFNVFGFIIIPYFKNVLGIFISLTYIDYVFVLFGNISFHLVLWLSHQGCIFSSVSLFRNIFLLCMVAGTRHMFRSGSFSSRMHPSMLSLVFLRAEDSLNVPMYFSAHLSAWLWGSLQKVFAEECARISSSQKLTHCWYFTKCRKCMLLLPME